VVLDTFIGTTDGLQRLRDGALARRDPDGRHVVACAAVLVILPPSEGKTAPRRGAPVDLSRLSFPALSERRAALLDALAELCAGPREAALVALGLSAGQAEDVARDAALRSAPAAAAAKIYTGVLYERLRLPELPAPARRRVLIASALWGMLRAGDRIPAYRLSIGARLPGFGALAGYWRGALQDALPASGLVLDLRSGAYAAAWTPRDAAVVSVRALTEERAVVSHMVKATRGDVARLALEAAPVPRTPRAVADAVAAAGHRVELTRERGGWSLDVIG
jgi:cytoplasmic iron level regulating protein YaaA (DUF328/UPF0246 family)